VKKLIAVLLAATFAGVSVSVIAADEKASEKKPSAEQCKANPKLKGCEKTKAK